MVPNPVVSVYVYGVFDDSTLTSAYGELASALNRSFFTTVVLSTFHIDPDGSLRNGKPGLMVDGKFNPHGDQFAELPGVFASIKAEGGTVTQLYYSVGNAAGSAGDIAAIQTIMSRFPDPTDLANPLLQNIQGLKSQLSIDGIDFDFEPDAPLGVLTYFTILCATAGLDVTYCPYVEPDLWIDAAKASAEALGRQPVRYMNVQMYGTDVDLGGWIQAVESAKGWIPVEDAANFLVVGFSCDGDGCACADSIRQSVSSALEEDQSLGGAFVWQMGDALPCPDVAQTLASWAAGIWLPFGGHPSGS